MRTSSEEMYFNPLFSANPPALQALRDGVFRASVDFANTVDRLEREAAANTDRSTAFLSVDHAKPVRMMMAMPILCQDLSLSLDKFFVVSGINATSAGNMWGVKSQYRLQCYGCNREFDMLPLMEAAINYGLKKQASQAFEYEEKTLMNMLKKFVVDVCTWLTEKTLERKIDGVFKEVGGLKKESAKQLQLQHLVSPTSRSR